MKKVKLTVGELIADKLTKEFGYETFVSSGYAYYDELVDHINSAVGGVEKERDQLRTCNRKAYKRMLENIRWYIKHNHRDAWAVEIEQTLMSLLDTKTEGVGDE